MTDTTTDPIAALLALEVPEEYRETVAVMRERAERARDELESGRANGPAMRLHIEDGLGHPDCGIDMLKAIQQVAAEAPRIAKFVETVKAFINERPEVITAIKDSGSESDYHRWQGHAEARRVLAEALGYTVPQKPGETTTRKPEDQA